MIYETSVLAIAVFAAFVGLTLGLSFYFGRRARSAQAYFAAGGSIHWFVNGVAFAGDYLSAASFLGICGIIAFYGYDGFLYSIGFLAGWIVALFVIAEPLKRLGRYTFADALDAQFHSRGIRLTAAISTLVVSIFYLIPQMVGAGTLIQPLFALPYWLGVVTVGAVVTLIVVTAGMVSTTYVQFIKGSLLVLFSGVLVVLIFGRGLVVDSSEESMKPQEVTITADGKKLVDGKPWGKGEGQGDLRPVGHVSKLADGSQSTGAVGPVGFLSALHGSEVVLWSKKETTNPDGSKTIRYEPKPTPGSNLLRPGNHPLFKGIHSGKLYDRLDFISLMLALFGGTAALPHILIRYYTVKDSAAARKSTVVGIGVIGAFYVLTLFLGLGAMVSGALDVSDENMAAPLLAKSFGNLLFAIISAIAFTTVLGTVSGLIVAASGAVVHDLVPVVYKKPLTDHEKVRIGKIAAVAVGILGIILGIRFQGMNVGFLVGWAFSVAASANLPALVMLLFWKRTTRQGISAAIVVGMVASLAWILLSADTYAKVYGLPRENALVPFSQPGIVTIPLGFVVLIVVSLLTPRRESQEK